jgi:hypothetical protein
MLSVVMPSVAAPIVEMTLKICKKSKQKRFLIFCGAKKNFKSKFKIFLISLNIKDFPNSFQLQNGLAYYIYYKNIPIGSQQRPNEAHIMSFVMIS